MLICFCFLNNCMFDSRFINLACQVSFLLCILKNFCFVAFKHFMTFLCLTIIVVTTPSCQTMAIFISFTSQMNVPFTIIKFCYRIVKTSLTCFSSAWVISSFYWVSWRFWSNCLRPITSPMLFLFHFCLWDSNSKGLICCLTHSCLHRITPCKCSNSKKIVKIFSHTKVSHPSPSWLMHEQVPPYVFPWNPHALKHTPPRFPHCKIQL